MRTDVVPASRLREAALKLRAVRLSAGLSKRWLWRGTFAVGMLAILGTGTILLSVAKSWTSRHYSIALEFLAVALNDGRVVQSPVQVQRRPDGADRVSLPCSTVARLPVYQVRARIRARFRSGHTNDWVGALGPNFHVEVAIRTENTHVALLPPPWSDAVNPGETIDFEDQVAPSDQSLFILARRFSPFDADRLQAELDQRLHGVKQSERLNVALGSLSNEAPAMLRYDFRAEEDRAGCRD
jgi:hypothetical protein